MSYRYSYAEHDPRDDGAYFNELEDAREERSRSLWMQSECEDCRGTMEDHKDWCKGNEVWK